MTTLEARISQLREAADRLETASANIRAAVENSHGIVQSLVARGVVSPAADQFFALYRRKSSTMNEWPDDLNDFARLLERAADAIEEAQRGAGHADGENTDDPTDQGGQGNQGNQGQGNQGQGNQGQGNQGQGNQGQGQQDSGGPPPPPFPVPTGGGSGTGSSGTGGGSSPGNSGNAPGHTGGAGSSGGGSSSSGGQGGSSGDAGDGSSSEGEPDAANAEPAAEPETYTNQANKQLADQVAAKQTEIETRRSNISNLEGDRSQLQQELDQMLQATGGQPTARIRGMQQQLADIDALINGESSTVDQLQQQVDALSARLDMVTPGPGADMDLIRSLEGSRTSEAILRATHQADNSVNCVNWVCTRVPIPPGIPTNARDWVQNAMNHPEYGIKVGDVPLTGSVIVMQPEHSFADDRFGHVMVVERVDPDGAVWVTDNFNHEPVLLSRLTNEVSGPNIQFLYLPWNTQA